MVVSCLLDEVALFSKSTSLQSEFSPLHNLTPGVSVAWGAFYNLWMVHQLSLPRNKRGPCNLLLPYLQPDWIIAVCSKWSCPLKMVWRLKLVHDAKARIMPGATCRDHNMLILKDLHWLPAVFWAQFRV